MESIETALPGFQMKIPLVGTRQIPGNGRKGLSGTEKGTLMTKVQTTFCSG